MPVTITEYVGPRAAGERIAAVLLLAVYGVGVAAPFLTPDSAAWELLSAHFPGGAERFVSLARTGATALAGIHGFEALLFDQMRLKKHGVPRFSLVWWQWSLTVFVEGMVAWSRFAKVVTEKTLKAK